MATFAASREKNPGIVYDLLGNLDDRCFFVPGWFGRTTRLAAQGHLPQQVVQMPGTQVHPKLLLEGGHQLGSGQALVLTFALIQPFLQIRTDLLGVPMAPVDERFPPPPPGFIFLLQPVQPIWGNLYPDLLTNFCQHLALLDPLQQVGQALGFLDDSLGLIHTFLLSW
jgi:hypothetical protein